MCIVSKTRATALIKIMHGGSNTTPKHWHLKTAPINIQSMCPVLLGMVSHQVLHTTPHPATFKTISK
jgi:hypothetical protein